MIRTLFGGVPWNFLNVIKVSICKVSHHNPRFAYVNIRAGSLPRAARRKSRDGGSTCPSCRRRREPEAEEVGAGAATVVGAWVLRGSAPIRGSQRSREGPPTDIAEQEEETAALWGDVIVTPQNKGKKKCNNIRLERGKRSITRMRSP